MNDLESRCEERFYGGNINRHANCVGKFVWVVTSRMTRIYPSGIGVSSESKMTHVRFMSISLAASVTILGCGFRDSGEAIQLEPKDSKEYAIRGVAKANSHDYTGAIKDLDEAIRLDSKNARNYALRGFVKSELKDYVRALEDYNEAVRLEPEFASAYAFRGRTKLQFKDSAGAIKDCDEAIRLDPMNQEAFFTRGSAKSDLHDNTGAIKGKSPYTMQQSRGMKLL